eukprot:1148188-Pelagomonas_calceolata.AAC.1
MEKYIDEKLDAKLEDGRPRQPANIAGDVELVPDPPVQSGVRKADTKVATLDDVHAEMQELQAQGTSCRCSSSSTSRGTRADANRMELVE